MLRATYSKLRGNIKRSVLSTKTGNIMNEMRYEFMARIRHAFKITRSRLGNRHGDFTTDKSIGYIDYVFKGNYTEFSGMESSFYNDKRILEIGPGDNLGVALMFIASGAQQVVCLDRFYSDRDRVKEIQIYKALRERLTDEEKTRFDSAVNLDNGLSFNKERINYIHGIPFEETETVFDTESFDAIVSTAVIEHIYNPEKALLTMDKLLKPGGLMIHDIDFRDHDVFSKHGMHPLTFLAIHPFVYTLMSKYNGKPNRKRLSYYVNIWEQFNYGITIFRTRILGNPDLLLPLREKFIYNTDYTDETIASIDRMRPSLAKEFRSLDDDDFLTGTALVIIRKPPSRYETAQNDGS